jgi:hypothetical protein
LAASIRQGQPASAQGHLIALFPPFLRWTLLDGPSAGGGAEALRLVADVYRRSARRRQQRLRVVAPLAAAVVIGVDYRAETDLLRLEGVSVNFLD